MKQLWIVLALLPTAQLSTLRADEPREIADIVAKLYSDSFLERETAMAELVEAGPAAIESVAKAVRRGDAEVIARGIHVLRELNLSDEDGVAQAARESLESLAADTATAAGRRAKRALESLDGIRSARALHRLRSLGAKDVTSKPSQLFETVFALQIDEQWRGSVEDLKYLGHLTEFEKVTFSGPQVKDEWLGGLRGMPNLRSLNLKKTSITAAGLAHITGMRRLEQLGIYYTPIGDEAIETLQKLRTVSSIRLYGTRMTAGAVADLNKQGGVIRFDFKRGGFLGVGGVEGNRGFIISRVEVGSSADKAGLRVGDVVATFEGHTIRDFAELTAAIAKNDAGDKVKVELLRNGKELVRELTLGEGSWERL